MTINVDDNTIGIWTVGLPGCDWLAGLSRNAEGRFVLLYRFRYYRDHKRFDSADRRSWTETPLDNDEDRSVALVRKIAAPLAWVAHSEVQELLMRDCTSVNDFMLRLLQWPCMEGRIEGPDEKDIAPV